MKNKKRYVILISTAFICPILFGCFAAIFLNEGDHIENIAFAVIIGIVLQFIISLSCLLNLKFSKIELNAVKVLSIIGMIPLLLISIMWVASITFQL